MTTYLGILILAAMASPLAVIYGGRWFDRWLGRRLLREWDRLQTVVDAARGDFNTAADFEQWAAEMA